MSRNKSQISVELIILLTIGMIFLVLLIKLYSDKNEQVEYHSDVLAARNVVNTLAIGKNNIASYSNGTSQTVYVQSKIKEVKYNLSIRDNILEISWIEGYYSYPLVTSNVSLTQGESEYTITKSVNEVIVQ